MKKIIYFFSALALMAGFTACEKPNNDGPNFDDIVLDGFYVYGEATGTNEILATNGMAAGNNEAAEGKPVRVGMYEKYIWLEANKDFSLVENSAGNKIFYGANLTEVNYGYDPEDPECKNFGDNPNMKIQQGVLIIGEDAPKMQVKETGLYHIVLDNNTLGDLDTPQIIVQKADWGVRGGMNGWGFTKGEVKNDNGVITYTWKDQEMSAKGEFKFASCHGWKINLDADGIVKAEVSLGLDDEGKLNNNANNNIVAGEKAGLYTIVLTYNCKAGALADSFSYTVELTQESSLPTACYLIGAAINGWDLQGNDEVPMIEAHSEAGSFWAIRYIADPTQGFKFSEISTDWGKDFTGRGTDTGYTVKDGNCFVSEAGLYMIEVDYKNAIVTVSKAEVYGMGDVFGNWDEGKNAFTAADGKFTATAANAGALRMYAKSTFAAATGNWWHREFNIYDGKIEYRAGGNDQAAVNVTAGQTITLDFNAGTGSIQ